MPTNKAPQVAINDIGSPEEFLAAIDATIKYFNDGDIVEGTVVKVDHDEVLLDIGYKTEGVIPVRELSIKHDVDPDEVVEVGDQIDALVLTKEDKEGRLILSKKRAQYERAWGAIEELKEKDEAVTGTVIEVVKVGQQIIENSLLTQPNASFWVYGLIFMLYFLCCWPLSLWAARLEHKWEH